MYRLIGNGSGLGFAIETTSMPGTVLNVDPVLSAVFPLPRCLIVCRRAFRALRLSTSTLQITSTAHRSVHRPPFFCTLYLLWLTVLGPEDDEAKFNSMPSAIANAVWQNLQIVCAVL